MTSTKSTNERASIAPGKWEPDDLALLLEHLAGLSYTQVDDDGGKLIFDVRDGEQVIIDIPNDGAWTYAVAYHWAVEPYGIFEELALTNDEHMTATIVRHVLNVGGYQLAETVEVDA